MSPRRTTRLNGLPEMFGVEPLHECSGLPCGTIREMLRRGTLPGKKLGRRWMMSRDAVLESLRADSTDSPEPQARASRPSTASVQFLTGKGGRRA